LINALIIVFLLVSAVSVGLIGLTAVGVGSGLKVGKISSATSGTTTTISVPVAIHNGGSLSLNDLRLDAIVSDSSGDQLLTGSAGPVTVGAGENKTVTVSLTLDGGSVSGATLQSLATNEQHLHVAVTASTSVPPFLTLSADIAASLEWGAPVNGLTVGSPTVTGASGTTLQVTVPVSFMNNNSYYTVSGQAQIKIVDSNGLQVGTGSLDVSVPPNTGFDQDVPLALTIPQSQVQQLLFNSTTLQYTAQVEVVSGSQTVFSVDEPLTYQWGAPLSGFTVGTPAVSLHNDTTVAVALPVSFTNANSAVDVGVTLDGRVTNATTGTAEGSGSFTVNTPHGGSFSQLVTMFVKLPSDYYDVILFHDATLRYSVAFSGSFQGVGVTFSRDIAVDWGAPLQGLTFQSATVTSHNSTTAQVTVPYSFTDRSAWLSVDGTAFGVISDVSGVQVGSIPKFTLSTAPGQQFSGTMTGYVKLAASGEPRFNVAVWFVTGPFEAMVEVPVTA
jgi:hypothetical protein